jgi:hypothetical protein
LLGSPPLTAVPFVHIFERPDQPLARLAGTCHNAPQDGARPRPARTDRTGMRSWKCRITATSLRGIEMANAPAAVLNSTT